MTYRVRLTGELLHGQSPAEAREELAQLFRISSQKAQTALEQAPVIIKATEDYDKAQRFERSLKELGLGCEILGGADAS